jgi:hypothetical protein
MLPLSLWDWPHVLRGTYRRDDGGQDVPLTQQLLLDLIAPPLLSGLWWLFSRGWATAVQAGEVSSQTTKRQKFGFLVVLAVLYLLMFGTTTYLHFA